MLDTTGQTLLSCTNTLHSSPDITGHLPRLENCELAMLLLALAWARKHEPGVVWWRLLSYNNILVSVSRMQEVIVYRYDWWLRSVRVSQHMSRYVTLCHDVSRGQHQHCLHPHIRHITQHNVSPDMCLCPASEYLCRRRRCQSGIPAFGTETVNKFIESSETLDHNSSYTVNVNI